MIDRNKKEGHVVGEKIMLSSVTGSGQLVEVSTKDALEEFTQLHIEVSDYLLQLRKNL
jgi:hypothetical protein